MNRMKDLNYFPLDVESNIYGMTTLEFEDGTSKVLVATLDCLIYCINYTKFKPQTREVEFTYIPNGAKIISIGALRRGPNDFVIGITHSLAPNLQKSSTRQNSNFPQRELVGGSGGVSDYGRLTTYYLNIYASGSMSNSFDLDYVAQGCQTIRLKYVPYHLYQTESITFADFHTTKELVRRPLWLLSSGDNCIHAFCEDRPYQSFHEVPIDEYFPELSKIPSLALWVDVLYLEAPNDGLERAVALGFEDGSVRLYHSVLTRQDHRSKFSLIRESSFDDYTTIIPTVRLFKVRASSPKTKLHEKLKSLNLITENAQERSGDSSLEAVNLLAVSSTNASMIFENVLVDGLVGPRYELPESCRLDCCTTAAIGDTNLDGLNEILIGTHGKELLSYQYEAEGGRYKLESIVALNYPVFSISIRDVTGDSLNDVIILLANGILMMQLIVRDVIDKCHARVDTLSSLLSGCL